MWISPLSVLQKITRTFIIWATVTTAVARRDITLAMTSVQRCSSSCSTLECLYPIHSTAALPNIRPQVIRHSSLSDIVVRAVYNLKLTLLARPTATGLQKPSAYCSTSFLQEPKTSVHNFQRPVFRQISLSDVFGRRSDNRGYTVLMSSLILEHSQQAQYSPFCPTIKFVQIQSEHAASIIHHPSHGIHTHHTGTSSTRSWTQNRRLCTKNWLQNSNTLFLTILNGNSIANMIVLLL